MAKKGSPMKRALILAVGCALLAGPGYAWAQSPPPGPDRDGGRMAWRDGGWGRDGRGGTADGTVMDARDGAETIAIGMTGGLTATTTREDQTRAGIMAGTRAI